MNVTAIAILGIIGGVLGVILFFKVWGMTDNVSKICKIVQNVNTLEDDAKTAMLHGQSILAQRLLDKRLCELKDGIEKTRTNNPLMQREYQEQLNKLEKLYDFYELTMPQL